MRRTGLFGAYRGLDETGEVWRDLDTKDGRTDGRSKEKQEVRTKALYFGWFFRKHGFEPETDT